MKALTDPSGRIYQIEAEGFPVADPLVWVDVPDDTTTHDTWDGAAVVKYIAPPPAPQPPATTFKADIWRRATEAEAEVLDALLASQPARLRNLYRDATKIDHADELFPILLGAMSQAFNEARALELLAPSDPA